MASYDTTRPMVDGRTFGVRPHGIFARLFGSDGALHADYTGEVNLRGSKPFFGDKFMQEKIRGG